MSFLALDPSKTNSGWAQWKRGWRKPIYASVCLGTSYTGRGQTNTKLRQTLIDIYTVEPFDVIFVERPICHLKTSNTSPDTVRLTLGIYGSLEGVAHELGIPKERIYEFDAKTGWQPGFCGREENRLIRRAAKLAQRDARDPIKAAVQEKCRQLGLRPQNSDQADAIGILTHGLLEAGIKPPWLESEILRTPLEIAR